MVTSGVTRLGRRGERLILAGAVRRGVFRGRPRSVALRLGELTLAETVPAREENGEPRDFGFRFVLSAGLQAVLAPGAPLSVVADDVELPFGPRVQARRSAMTDDPDLVREVAEKLRDGYVLTSKGELQAPFARRGAGLSRLLDHYERCDRLVHEILGHRLHVVGGTFLGALRNGGAIDHDVDFDAAYLSRARDAASVRAEYLTLLNELVGRGEAVILVNVLGAVRRRYFKWRSRETDPAPAAPVVIDVFPAFIDRAEHYCRPTFVRIPGGEQLILPLRRLPFGDREVWAPNRAVEKAELAFGPDWRKPDTFWRKPAFAGAKQAIGGLTLTDGELLSLASRMPEWQAAQLRDAVAARPGHVPDADGDEID